MDTDFAALVAIAARGTLAEEEPALADPDLDVLVAIAGAVPAGERRKHAQRSWQATEHAREAKKLRKTEREKEEQKLAKETALVQLDSVCALAPRVAATLGIRGPTGQGMTAQRAEVLAIVAFRPTIRGDGLFAKVQRRAVWLAARTLLEQQAAFVRGAVARPREEADPSVLEEPAVRHLSLNWQWDETTQRVRNILGDLLPGERSTSTKMAIQVMMQAGRLQSHDATRRSWNTTVDDPVICRASFLESQTSDFLLESLLRLFPHSGVRRGGCCGRGLRTRFVGSYLFARQGCYQLRCLTLVVP